MTPETLAGLLAEPARRRVLAAVVLGARSLPEITERAGLDSREAGRALQRLESGGLVSRDRAGYAVRDEVFAEIARSATPPAEKADHGYADPRTETVIRTFVRDGRLTGLPAQHSRRVAVLEHVVRSFLPGTRYPEREVNTLLRAWTADSGVDHVALRRYLVDEGLLAREDGEYWRCGGWVDVLGG